MFENIYFYLFLTLLFFGIGDIFGTLTKAKLSAVFVSLFLFLICFVTGVIPPDIIKQAGLTDAGKWVTPFIVFSMGTSINLREFIAEWRTFVTAVFSMIVVAVAGLALMPLIGYNETIVSVPIINGGIVATQIMTSAALDQGLQLAAALGAIVYAVQKFVGTPIASYFGLREARILVEEYRAGKIRATGSKKAGSGDAPAKPTFFESHKKYYGDFVSLAICGFFAWVSHLLGMYTGLASSIWALILGTVVSVTGAFPKNILKHSNSSGIFNVFIFATIIPSLAQIKMGDLATLGYSLVILFAVTCAVLFLFFYVLPFWKLLGSRNIAMGVSVGQLLGFPATYLVVNEVSKAVGENDAERQYISDVLMPKYLVSGFATVTSCSIIMAGIFRDFLQP